MSKTTKSTEQQLATFYLGDMLLGVDIHEVAEINRVQEMTPVPHAPPAICGVINLRGEVVTVIDLRTVLGLPRQPITDQTRTLVVNSRGEQIGLLVDRIADVVLANTDEIESRPGNVQGLDGRFFQGVYKLDSMLLIVLDVQETLAAIGDDASAEQ